MVTSVLPRWPGDATPPFVEHLAASLVEEGCEVLVLAPHAKGAARRKVHRGIRVHRFRYFWPFGLQKLCYEGGILVNLRTRPWVRLLLPFFILSELIAVVWQLYRFRPDVVHSHSLLPQGWVVECCRRWFGTPHVTTSHGNDVFGLRAGGLMGILKRRVVRRADLITVNSRATRDAVLALGAVAGKIRRIPAMPNPFRTAAPGEREVVPEVVRNGSRPAILFVGRVIEDKGVGVFLEALARLAEEVSEVAGWLVGEGQNRSRFERRARELGIRERLHWAGWVDPEAVPRWMEAADLLVVPSLREAQGLVVVEAMLGGCPVVASRVGGIPDMIEDGVCGRLVKPGDAMSLAEAIREVIENPEKRADYVAAARVRATAEFAPSVAAGKTLDLYRDLLTDQSRMEDAKR